MLSKFVCLAALYENGPWWMVSGACILNGTETDGSLKYTDVIKIEAMVWV